MSKSFLVKTVGEVTEVTQQEHTYIIQATSDEEAREIGKKLFAETHSVSSDKISLTAKPFNYQTRAMLAIIFMLVAVALSFVGWRTETGHDLIYFAPDLQGTFLATLFYSAFVVRFKGVEKSVQSVLDVLLSLAVLLLFASFFNIFLIDTAFKFLFWTVPIDSMAVIILAIALSWLGLEIVSAFCYLVVAFLAMSNFSLLNDAMEFGWVYVLCAFLGLLLYWSIEKTMLEATDFYRGYVDKSFGHIGQTFTTAKFQTSSLTKKITKDLKERGKK